MKKIIEYKIVTDSFIASGELTPEIGLTKKVNDLITQGWEPLGGISTDERQKLYQAMVRRDSN